MLRLQITGWRRSTASSYILKSSFDKALEDRQENINDIEDAMVRIGDLVAREFGMKKWPSTPAPSRSIRLVPSAGVRA